MGVTHLEIPKLETLLSKGVKSVIELGAQQQYTEGTVYGRYMSEWFKEHNIFYESIDLNGENRSLKGDLATIGLHATWLTYTQNGYDLVTDFGTSEHVSDFGMDYSLGKFSWKAIYNCWKNKFNLCKLDGWIYSVNPLTGNWPGHGFNYYTQAFYIGLANISGLTIYELDTIPAMGNEIDGWNVSCIMHKVTDKFPSLEEFKKLDLRPS